MFFGMEQIASAVSSSSPQLLKLLVDHSIKGSLLILLAWVVTRLLKSKPAAVRHFVWTITIITVVMLPIWSAAMPAIKAPILPGDLFQEEVTSTVEAAQLEAAASDREFFSPAESSFSFSWQDTAVVIWLTGAVLAFLWLLMGKVRAWKMLIMAHALDDETLLDVARVAADQIGLRPGWKIKVSDAVDVPLVVGNFGRTVLLPEEAYDWTREKLLILLLHEMSHIKRRDMLFQVPAELGSVIFWFNPLVWYAAHRQIIERELAADDHVLNKGVKVSDYATQLLEAANCLKRSSLKALSAAGMARRGQDFKQRLVKVLSRETNRKPLEKRYCALILTAITLLALPLSAWQTWSDLQEPEALSDDSFATAMEVLFSDIADEDPEKLAEMRSHHGFGFKRVVQTRDSRPYAERLSYSKNSGRANLNLRTTIDGEAEENIQESSNSSITIEKPKMVKFVKPVYPELAKLKGLSSSVHLRAVIDADGKVEDVQVVRESIRGFGFKDSAVKALKECRFIPARAGDKAVKVVTGINVRFEVH